MKYRIQDIIEYTIASINEFAKRFNLTEREAYRYLNFHNALSFIEKNYGIIHTLDFDEVVDSLAMFCKKSGGKL